MEDPEVDAQIQAFGLGIMQCSSFYFEDGLVFGDCFCHGIIPMRGGAGNPHIEDPGYVHGRESTSLKKKPGQANAAASG